MKSFLHVLLSLDVFLLGVLLILVPWMGYWDHNFFLDKYPGLIPLLLHPSVRGAVTGLGSTGYSARREHAAGTDGLRCHPDVNPFSAM